MTGCQLTFERRELKYVLSNDERQGLERACVVNDGSYGLSAGDDGIHSDSDLYILGGTIDITQSYEGLEGATVTVAGGDVSITSSDDGINASGASDDDETYVSGPTSDGDGVLDYAGTGTITGGVLIAAGSTGMAQNMGEASTQPSMLVTLAGQDGSTITVTDESGSQIASCSPTKSFSCVVISTPELEVAASYTVSAPGRQG